MKATWNGFTVTMVLAFLTWMAAAQIMPASFWFEIRSVMVPDTVEGTTPVMVIDRTIHRDFEGTYTVDVERQQPSGRFTVICSARNSTNYRADADLPDPVTLDWWTWPVQCQVGAGVYRVETAWRIEPTLFPDKYVRVLSNSFTIEPANTVITRQ